MFSLIIVIISIALISGIALATLFFGGDIFTDGKSDADAAKYINESSQISAAVRLFQAENQGTMPSDLEVDLVDNNYLKDLPASGSNWTIGDNALVKSVIDAQTCEKVNKKSNWENPNYPGNGKDTIYSPAACSDTAALADATYYCCTVPTP